MFYSIGKVSKIVGISISTLRYYDREGMFPHIGRSNGGIRVFSEIELDTIRVIECLKTSGMSIKEIKEFLIWCQEGDTSLEKRRDMFYNRFEEVQKQIEILRRTINTLKYKCWYYDTAVAAGTEDTVKKLPLDAIPENIRDYKI